MTDERTTQGMLKTPVDQRATLVTPKATRTPTAVLSSPHDPHADAVDAALAADAAQRAEVQRLKSKRFSKSGWTKRCLFDGPSTLKIEFLQGKQIKQTYQRTRPIFTHAGHYNMFYLQGDKDPFFSNYIKKIFNLDSAKLVRNCEEGIYGHIPPPDELTLQEPIVAGCDKSGRSFISVMLCNDRSQEHWAFAQCAKAHDACLAAYHHSLVLFHPFAIDNQDRNKHVLRDVWTWQHYIKPKISATGDGWSPTSMFNVQFEFSDVGLYCIDFNVEKYRFLWAVDKQRNHGLQLLSKPWVGVKRLLWDIDPLLSQEKRNTFREFVKSLAAKWEARKISSLSVALMEQAPSVVGASLWQRCIDRQLFEYQQISDWQSHKFVYFGCDQNFHKLKTFLRQIVQPEVLRSDYVEIIASLRAENLALRKAAAVKKASDGDTTDDDDLTLPPKRKKNKI